MSFNQKYFDRAIELAELGRGKTSPNPFVGCVIVKNNQIIGEGFTQPWGKDHAEVQALKQAGTNAQDSDIYVTLEPCAHWGKTPPCADAIIKAGVRSVYAGIKDPNPKVNGKGFAKLLKAGITVKQGIKADFITHQLEYYIKYITTNKPFIFMKNAVSLDAKISDNSGDSKWITGAKARERVHSLRAEADVIITGVSTVNIDDAMLNVRLNAITNQNPIRVILDPNLEIKESTKLVNSANDIKTILYTSSEWNNSAKTNRLLKLGLIVRYSELVDGFFTLYKIIDELALENISVVMVETGPTLSSSFLKEKLVDKIYYFIAPSIIGGEATVFNNIGSLSIKEKIGLNLHDIERIEQDLLLTYYIKN